MPFEAHWHNATHEGIGEGRAREREEGGEWGGGGNSVA